MNCSILSTLYMRANGDIPCQDDAGEHIVLGRAQTLDERWSISKVVAGPVFEAVRRSLRQGHPPWPGVCETCAWFRPNERLSDALSRKHIRILQLEPALSCNLKCPCCSQSRQILERPRPHRMAIDLFTAILKSLRIEGYTIDEIEYCGQGEPMLAPNLNEFIETCRELYPITRQRLITNGNFDYTRSRLSTPVDQIVVSCDGARQSSYEQYRVGGSLAKVLAFMEAATRAATLFPQEVIWKYILLEFNDSDAEILEAQAIAQEIGLSGLCFVFTHSRYKSLRYSAANSYAVPIVWKAASVAATPIHFQGVREFVPAAVEGWPCQSAAGAVFMLDEIVMDGLGELHAHGWLLTSEPVGRLRLFHNGTLAADTGLNASRDDVRAAYQVTRPGNLGFRTSWRRTGVESGPHTITVEVVGANGVTVATFVREYHVT